MHELCMTLALFKNITCCVTFQLHFPLTDALRAAGGNNLLSGWAEWSLEIPGFHSINTTKRGGGGSNQAHCTLVYLEKKQNGTTLGKLVWFGLGDVWTTTYICQHGKKNNIFVIFLIILNSAFVKLYLSPIHFADQETHTKQDASPSQDTGHTHTGHTMGDSELPSSGDSMLLHYGAPWANINTERNDESCMYKRAEAEDSNPPTLEEWGLDIVNTESLSPRYRPHPSVRSFLSHKKGV